MCISASVTSFPFSFALCPFRVHRGYMMAPPAWQWNISRAQPLSYRFTENGTWVRLEQISLHAINQTSPRVPGLFDFTAPTHMGLPIFMYWCERDVPTPLVRCMGGLRGTGVLEHYIKVFLSLLLHIDLQLISINANKEYITLKTKYKLFTVFPS